MDSAVNRNVYVETEKSSATVNSLVGAEHNQPYTIREIETTDDEMKNFLFTLGCYEGEVVTVISKLSGNLTIAVKDARYSIDEELASAILI